jgi:hypothetical protein
MKRVLLAALALCAVLGQASSRIEAQSPAPLSFFKNYFITGDYAVQGVGLVGKGANGSASGDIVIEACAEGDTERLGCVPKGVDVVAAFLYWQAVTSASEPTVGARGVTFKGQPLMFSDDEGREGFFGKGLGAGSPPCWAGGGGTGSGSGQNNLTNTYRADVLRFLDIDPETGKTAGYGTHTVRLPDSRRVSALGASLVVVYRDSSLPYSAIVMYEGSYAMANGTPSMTLPVEGFYDADDQNLQGKLTHIVGSGQANKDEVLFYNDTTWLNPFRSGEGANWDNPTFPVTVDPARRSITTGARGDGQGNTDCLTWAAVVYRTPVNDDDGDGLLNLWEESQTPVLDPYGRALPALKKMGANKDLKDIFLEVNYVKTDTARTYGTESLPAHSHAPAPEAVRLFGDMFDARDIRVHIDLGSAYDSGNDPRVEKYLVRDTTPGEGLARGGEWLDEGVTACVPPAGSPPWTCQFGAYPGTIGWKTGLRRVRDSFLNPPEANPESCDVPGSTCERRFDEVRRDIFRYALFAHHVGIPKSTRPCVDPVKGLIEDVGGVCPAGSERNPDFNVPRTYSGVADFPGGDLIVSLGGFKDSQGLPIGTPFMQASTLAHEFGHTAERRHGGEAFEPNCKPGYLSVMNYLYQLRGLVDDNGTPHLDFSDGTPFVTIDESAVQEGVFNRTPYRIGWYAPLDASYLAGQRQPSRARCDGSPLEDGERMVRIDARRSTDGIDWNANSVLESGTFAQDVNFNGRVNGSNSPTNSSPLKAASDDWSNLKLNQVGSRRNVGGQFRLADGTLAFGPLSLALGKLDLSPGDPGKLDLDTGKLDLDAGKLDLDAGKLDLGKLDLSLGKLDLEAGKLDLGKLDLDLGAAQVGSGDIGRGDFGGGDLFVNDPENPLGEIDATVAAETDRTPPVDFRACVVGVDADCAAPGAGPSDVVARFKAPVVGGVAAFKVFRVDGEELTPSAQWTHVNVVPADPAKPDAEDYVVIDSSELQDGASYTYFAVATYAADAFQAGVDSDPSNLRTIVGRNLPFAAGPDSYSTNEDTALVVPSPGVLVNDGDPDSPVTLSATVVTGPAHGALVLHTNGGFTYTPNANYHGPDGFTYRPFTGSTVVGTVSITVAPVADAPTISGLPTQLTIDQDTVAGPISFTVADADGGALTLGGSSSNTTLVPNAAIVFGGSGGTRSLTITPAAGQTGTANITVVVTDAGGLATSAVIALTVNAAGQFTFVGLKNIPPPTGTTFKTGRAIPLSWQYRRGTTPVDSRHVTHVVRVAGPLPNTTQINTDPGTSEFRYQASSRTWMFNLQTRNAATGQPLAPGTYQVTITPSDPQFAPSPTFTVVLVR